LNWRTDGRGHRILEIDDITHNIKCRTYNLDWELTSVRWKDSRYGVHPEMIDHNWFMSLRDAKKYVEKRIKKLELNKNLGV